MANACPPSVGLRLAMRDHPVLARGRLCVLEPAVVADGARVEDAHLVERHVHVRDRARVDAVVGAQRPVHRVEPPVLAGDVGRHRHVDLVPEAERAGAVLVPALERAAKAGARVLRARELVVAARHGVEHPGRDARIRRAARLLQQVAHDGGEREARAGARVLLVEDRQLRLRAEGGRRGDGDRGLVRAVAQVHLVGRDVADGALRGGCARGAGPGAAGLRRHGEFSFLAPGLRALPRRGAGPALLVGRFASAFRRRIRALRLTRSHVPDRIQSLSRHRSRHIMRTRGMVPVTFVNCRAA